MGRLDICGHQAVWVRQHPQITEDRTLKLLSRIPILGWRPYNSSTVVEHSVLKQGLEWPEPYLQVLLLLTSHTGPSWAKGPWSRSGCLLFLFLAKVLWLWVCAFDKFINSFTPFHKCLNVCYITHTGVMSANSPDSTTVIILVFYIRRNLVPGRK